VWVGALRVELLLRQTRSLKDKRRAYQQLRDRVMSRFDVAVALVEEPDNLGRLVVGVAAVGGDPRTLRSVLDRVAAYIDELYIAPVARRETSIERFSASPGAWIPDDVDWE
jgi:uncharacterized protein YlxP (DUF503 family)